ncbi:MAG: energy transducer TonB, partial [Mucilaginibacter sp.]
YLATNILFPQCDARSLAYMGAIQAQYENGTATVSFVVNKKGKVKDCQVVEKDSVSSSFAKRVANAFSSFDLTWKPAKINNLPVNTLVSVTLKCGFRSYNGSQPMNWMTIQYPFLPKLTSGKELSKIQQAAAKQYFRTALEDYNNQDYKNALDILNQDIEMDDLDVGAYYLRAMVNIALNNKKEACKDWTILAGLGQVKAAKNLAKFCTN